MREGLGKNGSENKEEKLRDWENLFFFCWILKAFLYCSKRVISILFQC